MLRAILCWLGVIKRCQFCYYNAGEVWHASGTPRVSCQGPTIWGGHSSKSVPGDFYCKDFKRVVPVEDRNPKYA